MLFLCLVGFLLFLSVCQLTDISYFLAFPIFAFFLPDSISDQALTFSPVSRHSGLQLYYTTLMFLLALPSPLADSPLKFTTSPQEG